MTTHKLQGAGYWSDVVSTTTAHLFDTIKCLTCKATYTKKTNRVRHRMTAEEEKEEKKAAWAFMDSHTPFGVCLKHGEQKETDVCRHCTFDEKRKREKERKRAAALDGQMCKAYTHGGFHAHPCGRPSKVRFDPKEVPKELKRFAQGEQYSRIVYRCAVHDPMKQLRRDKERHERYAEQDKRRAEIDRNERRTRGEADAYNAMMSALGEIASSHTGRAQEIAQEAIFEAEKLVKKAMKREDYEDE